MLILSLNLLSCSSDPIIQNKFIELPDKYFPGCKYKEIEFSKEAGKDLRKYALVLIQEISDLRLELDMCDKNDKDALEYQKRLKDKLE